FSEGPMATLASFSFRVGKVLAYRRGRVWYLCYHDGGIRRRPRVGPDRHAARQLAAQLNAQLAVGAPAALSFEPLRSRFKTYAACGCGCLAWPAWWLGRRRLAQIIQAANW